MEQIGTLEVARLAENYLNLAAYSLKWGTVEHAREHARRAVEYRSELRRRAALIAA